MASPQSERLLMTPSSGRPLSITPGSRVLQSPISDEAIWKRLKEAGFDEESIRRRDKAALIAYIAKLEAEVCYFSNIFFSLLFRKLKIIYILWFFASWGLFQEFFSFFSSE